MFKTASQTELNTMARDEVTKLNMLFTDILRDATCVPIAILQMVL